MKNNWKTLAIILLIIVIVLGSAFAWLMKTGLDIIEKEEECSDYCYRMGHESYQYLDRWCYCYVNGVIEDQLPMK